VEGIMGSIHWEINDKPTTSKIALVDIKEGFFLPKSASLKIETKLPAPQGLSHI
jgi:hypothetical protein